jgi:hypothetical protein
MAKKTVAQEIRELGNKLMKINEDPFDIPEEEPTPNWSDEDDEMDFGSPEGDDDLDIDDDGDPDAGFTQKSMYDQLGKILDSQGNPTPVETVTTDDKKEIPVSAGQAKTLRMFATADNVKPNVRLSFLKDIQHSRGLADFLDVRDYKEMADLFIKKYL